MTATHEDMVCSIIAEYERSTPDQRRAGAQWYAEAGRIVRGLADITDVPVVVMAGILATLSPRNPWAWNVQDAASVALAARKGGPCPSVTTFRVNADKAYAMARADGGRNAAGPKVRNFALAILGDVNAVVVDVWAARVATGGLLDQPGRQYERIAQAYRTAAILLDIPACHLQAITWLSAQSRGLGSARKGRHDLTIKSGTLPAVVALLKGAQS